MGLCNLTDIYSFILQVKVQGFTGTMHKVTTHPLLTYLKKSYTLNTEQDNLVLMSNCLSMTAF
jgi:hypothetical protein